MTVQPPFTLSPAILHIQCLLVYTCASGSLVLAVITTRRWCPHISSSPSNETMNRVAVYAVTNVAADYCFQVTISFVDSTPGLQRSTSLLHHLARWHPCQISLVSLGSSQRMIHLPAVCLVPRSKYSLCRVVESTGYWRVRVSIRV